MKQDNKNSNYKVIYNNDGSFNRVKILENSYLIIMEKSKFIKGKY